MIRQNSLQPHIHNRTNNYKFSKDLEVVRFGIYSHYPYNTISLLYSIHQVSLLRKSYAQEYNIDFDYVIRIRSDMIFTQPINLSNLDNINLSIPNNTFEDWHISELELVD